MDASAMSAAAAGPSSSATTPTPSFASVPEVAWNLVASYACPPDVYRLSLSSRHFFSAADGGGASSLASSLSRRGVAKVAKADATRALEGAIDSALDDPNGLVDASRLEDALGAGYSKFFVMARAEEAVKDARDGGKAERASKRVKAAANDEDESDAKLPAKNNDADAIDFDRPLLATGMLRESLFSSLGRVLKNSKSKITLESLSKMPEGALVAGSTVVQACLGVDGVWTSGRFGYPSDVDIFCSARAAPAVRSVSKCVQ